MITDTDQFIESFGTEPKEIFGYASDEELEQALFPLMQEIEDE